MKFLGWILFFSITTAYAEQVIEPAPLSVEDDGTRKIIDRKEGELPAPAAVKDVIAPPPAEALVIPNDDVVNPPAGTKKEAPKKTAKSAPKAEAKPVAIEVKTEIAPISQKVPPRNPIDGQLRLDGPAATTEAEKPVVITDKDVTEAKIDVLAVAYVENPLKKYLQFSFGYVNSRYEKIHPSLDNGSSMVSFKFVADMTPKFQSGFAVEILSDTSGQTVPDNIRAVQYRLFVDRHSPLYYRPGFRMDWVGGLSLSIGDFGIRRRYLNGLGQEVSVKLKDGVMVGLIPAAGLRFYLLGQNSFDLMVEYHQYFGNPQKYIGGLAVAPRVNLEF